jgi:S-adenosylmethionine:diacylglycerol 3-amino-3-carboxypropyl transferase
MTTLTAAFPSAEAAHHADFSIIRYAQCWEDADVLLAGLAVEAGDRCLSIASAGDNTLALLTRQPGRVIALDLNAAQLACLELRVAAYRRLDHAGLLALIGSRESGERAGLYQYCRGDLSPGARRFWDDRPGEINRGIGSAGKFERYFQLFRERVLPWVHSRNRIGQLLRGGTLAEREHFYERHWNTWRWRFLFRVFFSRRIMGRCGRDPSFFRYVEGSVADRILARGRYALTRLNPRENPYLHWILTGRHGEALPLALRPESFEVIRDNLDRLEIRHQSLEDYLVSGPGVPIDRFNLSDVFEYMSEENFRALLARVLEAGRSGSRLVYWNTLVPRRAPEEWRERVRRLDSLSRELHARDRAFFYGALNVEEIV